jgi:NTE family protein
VRIAVKQRARRPIILPTGHACANDAPPVSAVANALRARTLLIARQSVNELEDLGPEIAYLVVPPLCPLMGSPYDDISCTAEHIERARENTDAWIAAGGLTQQQIPHELRPHEH